MQSFRDTDRLSSAVRTDEGQVSIVVVLAIGLFLLLFVGFGVDMTNLFFHRQMAQNAADAACVAAGMDMLVNQTNGGGTFGGGFVRGTAFDCNGHSGTPGYSPCQYAALNGYSSPSTTPLPANTETNGVHVSFPGSVPGVTVDTTITGANPFVQVDVYDEVKVYFSSLLSGSSTQTVHALAKCGLQNAQAPVPIIVLDPTCTHAFEVSGNATLQIIGGPSKSVQVNSDDVSNPGSPCAAATGVGTCSGNATVDLQYGGNNFTGSAFGTFGGQLPAPPSFLPGTTGSWQLASPIADPWANLIAPPQPAPAYKDPPTKDVAYKTDGCPDAAGCTEYSPGWYTNPICVGSSCKPGPGTADLLTAIFDPGIYYITGSTKGTCGTTGKGCIAKPTGQCQYGLYVDSNGVVRPADPTKAPGDGSYGTLFYFSSAGGGGYESAFFGANAGKSTVDNFPLSIGSDPNYPGLGMNCPGASVPQQPGNGAPQLPTGFQGDVLVGPCTGPNGTLPSPSSRVNYYVQGTDPLISGLVQYHGMLFWDDRANNDVGAQPHMQGGGGLLLGGNLYFHNCPEAPSACAAPPTDYNAFLDLQGTPGSATYVFGNITTDELVEGGNSTVTMELNPNLVTNILKVAMLQ